MRFQAPPEVMRYIVPKGFIAVDGVSLTVPTKDAATFGVSIVGFTRRTHDPGRQKSRATSSTWKWISSANTWPSSIKPQDTGITAEFLQEHGFPVN